VCLIFSDFKHTIDEQILLHVS